MKYSPLALITLLLITGCAHKQRVPMTPGTHHYKACKEVSINVKTDEVTVVCPLHPEVTK